MNKCESGFFCITLYHRRTKSKSTYLFHVGKFMGFVVPARSCHYQQFEENESHGNHHLLVMSNEHTRTKYGGGGGYVTNVQSPF